MAKGNKYRHIVSAILLAVYAFISTPIQVWHTHQYVASSATTEEAKDPAFLKWNSKAVDANCQVCSFHYSAYAGNDQPELSCLIIDHAVIHITHLHHFPAEPYFHSPGRGPPSA